MKPLAGSLYRQTLIAFVLGFVVLQIIIMAISTNFIMRPILNQSVNDFAGLLEDSITLWQRAPTQRQALAHNTVARHQFYIEQAPTHSPYAQSESYLPYVLLLEQALSDRLAKPIIIYQYEDQNNAPWYRMDVPLDDGMVQLRFKRSRIGTQPPLVLFSSLLLTIGLGMLMAFILAKRLVKPIDQLGQATKDVAHGRLPKLITETGPDEIRLLAGRFNRMAQQVQQLLTHRTTLLSGISHDLRTPLTRLGLHIEMARDDIAPDRLLKIEQELQTMDQLIGEFLDFSRGMQVRDSERTNLVDLIQQLVEQQADPKRFELNLPVECSHEIDRLSLERVLSNLISNALKHAAPPYQISLRCNEQKIEISLRDHGEGIPVDKQQSIFEPFVRLHAESGTGSGLGLAIVHQIASAHDWKIDLRNAANGGLIARLRM